MITIVDYGVGNIASLRNMLDHVGAEVVVSADPAAIVGAGRLVLPGVGAFDYAMGQLRDRGLDRAILDAAGAGADILGVCLGLQLLARRSEEGRSEGLGLIAADVIALHPTDPALKVPNIGWREVEVLRPNGLIDAEPPPRFYHDHGYALSCDDPADVIARIDYGGPVTVAVSRGRIHGVQFHPEKSHRFGMAVMARFAGVVA